ncbi:TetR/AcrR family transcriptional regulator [Hymenobacter volaticus]|uniref:TetR/AcrR family transcriptional regulator n=1 Tax=Hymenobacter volaticus TaxID=2932254 RepID=A0ABY4GEH8_9BACT|nr:TetR/AcrR family transcriptional regulator [Hymenobacter volaticus]UOQ69200.1 TetR/AcrR family transcriptional regulator [Hymenobacter volaticus]
MKQVPESPAPKAGSAKLSKAARRQQLLAVALVIVREEGADSLTLGHLAARAGVSKPIPYEHFGTRAGLLAELYKSLDQQQVTALRAALQGVQQNLGETADVLATAYIHCAADTSGEIYAVGAALSGSEEMGAVHQELLAGYVQLFAAALAPHSPLPPDELHRRCVGLVGAGEALSLLMVGGQCRESDAAATFSALIRGGVQALSSTRNDQK